MPKYSVRRAPRPARALALALLLGALGAPAGGQAQARKVIDQNDYDLWRSIQGATLSPDGRWAVYTVTPAVGEGELVARSTASPREIRVPRGYTGRPQLQAGAQSRAGFTPPAAQVTADSRHVLFTILPARAAVERARREKRKEADQPKSALGILRLEDGQVTRVPRVKSFKLAEESGRWVAYLLEADSAARTDPPPAPDTTRAPEGAVAATPGGTPRPIAPDSADGAARRKETGTRLVLRDLSTGAETGFDDVLAYELDETGAWLAMTVSSRAPGRDGVYLHSLADGRTRTVLSGEGRYRQLAFDEAGTQLAFVTDRDTRGNPKPVFSLYHAPVRTAAARAVVTPMMLDRGWTVSDRGTVAFSRSGSALRFGVAEMPLDSIPADSLADKAVFDLWHWQDTRLQPQQRVEASRDRDRALTAVYQLGARRLVKLATDSVPEVTLSDDGRVALGRSELPYAIEAMWGEGGSDVWLIDALTGARTRVAERIEFDATLSPDARFVLWFHEGSWRAHDVAARRTVELTKGLGARFDREDWSTPSTPEPWGVAGWTPGDRSVLLYDRYDVWEVDPTGRRPARALTAGAGRAAKRVYRVVDLDEDEPALDTAQPLLLSVFDEATKASGFAEARAGAAEAPRTLALADAAFGTPQRAEDAPVYLVTRSTFRDFPDLWAGSSPGALQRLSDANPQQARYAWGSVELVRWTSADGAPLEGLLYRPDGFDPAKKYPMVVYFYERHSDDLHLYVPPAGRNVVNPTVYTSLGYLVFMPNIDYATGYPGPSAVKSIVPGVQALLARGFVEPNGIGIAGQSWGGYQTAYLVTQSHLFRAAVANAPVANMTSAYGGIRWQTGLARAFQYEHTQSRIGGSLWEYPMRFLENSPLFQADRIRTPLLMMHNDGDGAVPWYQGIEMFVALRRLGKEVYLINYNGDEHNPTKRANQKDIDLRMQQFFAHHLRGAPAPGWMREGIPYLRKGRDQVGPPPVTEAAPTEAGVTSAASQPGG